MPSPRRLILSIGRALNEHRPQLAIHCSEIEICWASKTEVERKYCLSTLR